ncbi:MAG: feruloyl-CoA synthase [Pseudomonadota bacterium]|nr:feruloyl-CoA synthase [Pseudomonadota bacterium]
MADLPIKNITMAEPLVDVEEMSDGSKILRSPQTLEEYPENQSKWIFDWAKKAPTRIFLADRSGLNGDWRSITYFDFSKKIKSIGQALLDRSEGKIRPIAILSDNSVNNALLLYGAMHVGIPVVPISPAYSLLSQDFGKLKYILANTSPNLIYIEDGQKFRAVLESNQFGDAEIIVSNNIPDNIEVTPFDELISVQPTSAVDKASADVTSDTIAKILFTSGSTGQPKGVINTQGMLCSNQQAMSQVWTFLNEKPPVTVDWLPWNHTFGGNHNLNMILRNGGTLYIDFGKPAPGLIEETIRNLKEISPTIYFNVPRGYDMLLPYFDKDQDLRRSFFANLEMIFYAAAALTQSTWEKLEYFSELTIKKRVMMLSGWGATETAPDCTHVHWPISKAGVIGLPIPGTEIKLVPNENKIEMRVRGPNVMPGYWKQDELTEEVFDEDGFYCIGDAARLEDPGDIRKGIIFDGRISENFKLSTGTWVAVGSLRTDIIASASNVIQDAVVTGHDRDEIGLLIFPNVLGCRTLCPDLSLETELEVLLSQKNVKNALVSGLMDYNSRHSVSSRRVTRAILMTEPANIDKNEITDKGYVNQRAVLERRSNLVDKLYKGAAPTILIE